MATIPGNALQERLHQHAKFIKKPSFGVKQKRIGKLMKLWDRDAIEAGEIPSELQRAIAHAPGKLYGEVKISSDKIVFLPFAQSPEMIYSIYGDSMMIEGRMVTIWYHDNNVRNGEIEMGSNVTNSLTNTKGSTDVFDIGSIFGA